MAVDDPGDHVSQVGVRFDAVELTSLDQRYERGSTILTSNLPFEDWTSVLGSERLTGCSLALLKHS